MTVKPHIKIFVSISFLLTTVLVIVVFYYNKKYSFWEQVKSHHIHTNQVVAIKDVTDFDWDRICVLGPYSVGYLDREKQIESILKADLNSFVIPDVNDDYKWAFIFILEENVIKVASRGFGYNIQKDFDDNCLAYVTANFYFEEDDLYIRDYLY